MHCECKCYPRYIIGFPGSIYFGDLSLFLYNAEDAEGAELEYVNFARYKIKPNDFVFTFIMHAYILFTMKCETSGTVYRYIHKWVHEDIKLVIHTIPMFHIGMKAYYKRINEIIDDYNHVLVEGIPLNSIHGINKSKSDLGAYRKLAKILDLTSQKKELKIPADIITQNIDIDKS